MLYTEFVAEPRDYGVDLIVSEDTRLGNLKTRPITSEQ